MADWMERQAATLADAKAGWVTRRDAAEALGKVASRALEILHKHRDEPDVDVRSAIDKALAQATAELHGGALKSAAPAQPATAPLETLAQKLAKEGSRAVTPEGAGFLVHLKLRDGRAQDVHIASFTGKDGAAWARVSSLCGPYAEKAALWSLRANLDLSYCAIAVEDVEGAPRLLFRAALPLEGLTFEALKTCVKEAAYSADWMEKKLTGEDAF